MDPLNLKKLNAARRARQAVALVTSIADGRDRIVHEGDPVGGELGEALARAFRSGKSGMVTADGAEFFINVHLPPARIVVIGAVHISQALAPMAKIAGFDISKNPGLTATLYNIGDTASKARELARRNRKSGRTVWPEETYYGWIINEKEDELRALLED